MVVISVDSLDQSSIDQSVLEGTPNEVGAPLEEGISVGGPSHVDEIGDKASSGVTASLVRPLGPTSTEPRKKRLPNGVLLSIYVPTHERIHPSMGMVALDLEGAREIIHCWSPFNQAKSPIAHMCGLYPNYFRVPLMAR